MSTILISYADAKFRMAQSYLNYTARKNGNFNSIIDYSIKDIDIDFQNRHKYILSNPKGAGYWLWKPYIILEALKRVKWGDFVFYSDAACAFLKSSTYLTQLTYTYDQDIISFELDQIESKWTKRDAFFYMNADSEYFHSQPQRLASQIVLRKTKFSLEFVQEYLAYCTDPRIITDDPNQCGLENYSNFTSNRHDQSVFSLLCKKHGIAAFRDPSQWGNSRVRHFNNSNYPQILYLSRQSRPKETGYKFRLKKYATKAINLTYSKLSDIRKK